MLDGISVDFICLLEADEKDWEWAKKWIDESKERRLVIVDSKLPVVEHPQIKWRAFESPLQIEPFAKQTAWEAVFLKMQIIGGKGEASQIFRKELETAHYAVNLLLSDAADWGCGLAKHCFARKGRSVRQGMKLRNAFRNIPAIIVGAGPSLEKNGHLLEKFRDQALIFAGGSALNVLHVEPHFAASIDKEAPYRDFKKHPFAETPFCFQSRMNPDNFSLVHGEAILFPDSHFRFLNEGEGFEGGWTVGTFLVAIATLMGCNPIVLVGMDYCYHEGRKYAEGEDKGSQHLVEAIAKDGRKVRTQADWLAAQKWLEEWAVKHPEHEFYNATDGGLGFASPIRATPLDSMIFKKKENLRELVHQAISELPFISPMNWEGWKESLIRCNQIATSALLNREEKFEGEMAYESLLLPLWHIWSHVFIRALESDPHPDKLTINRLLFFQQVTEEHLRAIE